MFSQEILSERSFTFWDWFYSAMKLFKVDQNIRDLWQENLIMGFVARDKTETLLKTCQPGTAILRFADSCLGGLSVSWIHVGKSLSQSKGSHYCICTAYA